MTALAANRREKDVLWWTELEFRRLGNVVCEMLHSKRYARGNTTDRAELRCYLDSMRKKSLRILHRAEKFSTGHETVWCGLDTGLVENHVLLGEEYVGIVEKYEEEFGVSGVSGISGTKREEENNAILMEQDDWEERDAREYAQALASAKEAESDSAELFAGNTSEIRQRKNITGQFSAKDEEFLARHNPVQEQLTSTLLDGARRLKNAAEQTGNDLRRDDAVVDDTADALDANLNGIQKQRGELAKLERSSSMSWYVLIAMGFFAVLVTVLVVAIIFTPM